MQSIGREPARKGCPSLVEPGAQWNLVPVVRGGAGAPFMDDLKRWGRDKIWKGGSEMARCHTYCASSEPTAERMNAQTNILVGLGWTWAGGRGRESIQHTCPCFHPLQYVYCRGCRGRRGWCGIVKWVDASHDAPSSNGLKWYSFCGCLFVKPTHKS